MGDSSDFQEFYELVKNWTIKDHYTPQYRSEVIWDMLLSEFVPALICYKEEGEKGRVGSYRLIAKEFPISTQMDKKDVSKVSLSNAKIDYLVENEEKKCIYIVELKTTNASFDHKQFARYVEYINNGPKSLAFMWEFYYRVLDKNLKPLYFEGRPEKCDEDRYLTHVKYLQQVSEITECRYQSKDHVTNAFSKFAEDRSDSNWHVKVVYISFYEIDDIAKYNKDSRNTEQVINIVLNDLNDSEKSSKFSRLIENHKNAEDYDSAIGCSKVEMTKAWLSVWCIISEMMRYDKDYGLKDLSN
ncbi:MAG: hypothetical protein IK078_02290 [Lachnospiraceae bacterium]|nr:hypothetical protein [Lachnospiraceae bacterium]